MRAQNHARRRSRRVPNANLQMQMTRNMSATSKGSSRHASAPLPYCNRQDETVVHSIMSMTATQKVRAAETQIKPAATLQNGCYHSIALTRDGRVFSCGAPPSDCEYVQCGHGQNRILYFVHGQYHVLQDSGWHGIHHFANHTIVQIAVGLSHALFLDSAGAVWACGRNGHGQIGIGMTTDRYTDKTRPPTKIAYFEQRNIRVTQIASGCDHVLALDSNGTTDNAGKTQRKSRVCCVSRLCRRSMTERARQSSVAGVIRMCRRRTANICCLSPTSTTNSC